MGSITYLLSASLASVELDANMTQLYVLIMVFMIASILLSFLWKNTASKLMHAKAHAKSEKLENIKLQKQMSINNNQLSELTNFREGMTEMIVHDMKGLLKTVLEYAASDPHNKKLYNISQSGNLVYNLIINMLDVEKFQREEVSLNVIAHDIQDVLKESREQIELLLQMREINCYYSHNSVDIVSLDKELIIRAIVNILTNTIKFSQPGSTIWIKSENSEVNGKNWLGIQIEERRNVDLLDQLLLESDRDSLLKVKNNDHASSTWLGFTFCKLVIEKHGGTIDLRTTSEGNLVSITLPQPQLNTENKKEQRNNLEIDQDTEKWILQSEEKQLKTYHARLTSIEIYQVGELNKIFEELDKKRLNSPWVSHMKIAVYNANLKKYNELIQNLQSN